jgi:peptidoglycan/LPS O-acetylase OafA/YrhL
MVPDEKTGRLASIDCLRGATVLLRLVRLRRTGVISYSIYVTHWPAVWLSFTVLRVGFGRRAMTPNIPEYIAQLVFLMIGGYGTGWLYFQFVERHFLNERSARDTLHTAAPTSASTAASVA